MKKHVIFGTLLVLLLAVCAANAQTGQVGGKILGEDGKPLVNAKVVYSDPNSGRKYTFKTDKKGEFVGLGLPYGNYNLEITTDKGEKAASLTARVVTDPEDNQIKLDLSNPGTQQTQHILNSGSGGPAERGPIGGSGSIPSTGVLGNKGGQAQTQSGAQGQSSGGQAGQSGQQQQPKYTKEQIEEMKKQNEKAMGANALIKQAQEAMNAKNWQEAIPPLQQLISTDPNNWQYQSALGDSYFYSGQFDQAIEAYEKGIQVAEANTTVDPKNPITDPAKKKTGEAKMLTNEGNAYLKLHKNKEAVDAYTKAASMDPNPSIAYFNLCATQYNTGNVDGALQACDKAIAADPNKADAYFIKGSLMMGESKMENNKMVPPPGTAEALNKYLELQPDGPHAADVKQMLAAIGAQVETTYKKRGK